MDELAKFFVIGDPHFKTTNVEETEALTLQTDSFLSKSEKFDFIVCLGDILDTHERVHLSPLHRSIEFLKMLSSHAPTYLLIGNHDRRNNSDFLTNIHAFHGVDFPDLHIIDTVIHENIKGQDFVFVPYVPPGRFEEALKTMDFDYTQSRIIFAHQEFKGCKMGAIISEIGDMWPLESPFVISGHIHDFQIPQKNILYTGTPLQHAFGDSDDKYLFIIETTLDTMDTKTIKLLIDKKVVVHVDYSQFTEFVPKAGQMVKLVVHGTPEELKVIKTSEHAKLLGNKDVKVFYKAKDVTMKDVRQSTISDIQSKKEITFEQVLYKTIQGDEDMEEMYREFITL